MPVVIYMASLIVGAAIGILLLSLTKIFIIHRDASVIKHELLFGKSAGIIWSIVSAICLISLVYFYGVSLKTIECFFVFSVCIVLSSVDISIRRIPNELLISIIVGALVFMVLSGSLSQLLSHIFGLFVSTLIFVIPFFFQKQAGAGDIKYAAVIGFFLGLYLALYSFVIMAAIFFLYTSVLLISKKGNFKTKIALGPYMSIGFFVSTIMMNKPI